jgi:hypothetical protein
MMKKIISFFLVLLSMGVSAQQYATVVYDFNSDRGAIIDIPGVINADEAVFGGTKLQFNGLVTDGTVQTAKSTITNNNSTNYAFTFLSCNLRPASGHVIQIEEIKLFHKSSKAGNPDVSQTYLYRIGCTLNGRTPDNTDAGQSTENRLLPGTYEADSFVPGNDYNTASGDDYLSAFFTVRGASTSNDVFEWYVDKIEIKVSYYKLLDLPDFSLSYDFNNQDRQPLKEGISQFQASAMSSKSAAEGLTTNGRYWIKLNANSNTIAFKNMGLLFDIAPDNGYEVVMKNYEIEHAGSGVPDASCVNRIAVFRDISRDAAGIEAGREDFTEYTGRGVFGDDVPAAAFKKTTITDNLVFSNRQYFTISVNRKGSPAEVEYWTVEKVRVNGWIVPSGRGNLLNSIAQGEQLLLNAKIGEETGKYTETVFLEFLQLLTDATAVLSDPNADSGTIATLTVTVEQAVADFPGKVNSGEVKITINTQQGIPLNEGFAGFNMRIADGPWTYTHPEFREGVKKMNPGFLRYFSGTSGDYFDIHTGQYELQWFEGTSSNPGTGGDDGSQDDFSSIPSLYKWMEGKGAHRFYDFARMCGETGTKIVVTWNGFYESAHKAAQFARFCKNNHVIVDSWQFCNEPNFFVPPRRYIWNDGGDYAAKMKEIADSIKSVLPDANLALSYGWNWGNSTFAAQIKSYQNNKGRFWDHVSIHAYPTHRNADAEFYDGFITANKALDNNTNNSYFNSMVNNSWPNAKLMITEFGVWNDALGNTNYSGIYVAEYFMRLSQQIQASMIGKHHIASAFKPVNKYQTEIMAAWENQTPLNTDLLETGYFIDSEGYGHYLVNKVFKNSSFSWKTTHDNTETVAKRDGGTIPAIYATSYKGMNDRDYLLITNKTAYPHDVSVLMDGSLLDKQVYVEYFTNEDPAQSISATVVDSMPAVELQIKPYSVTRVEWKKENDALPAPLPTRIYHVEHKQNAVLLQWWKRDIADSYTVSYGTSPGNYTQSIVAAGNTAEITGLVPATTYYFAVKAVNATGESQFSNEISTLTAAPATPVINYKHEDAGRIAIHWESVPYANGYRVRYGTSAGVYTSEVDAGNITGYVFRKLQNDQPYYFSVTAYNGSGESIASTEIMAKPLVNRPWPPYLVNASEKSTGAVRVAWTPSDSTHNAKFNVYYCPTPWNENNYQLVGSAVEGNVFTDYTARSAGVHYYRVKAVNQVSESQFYSLIATVEKSINGITGLDKLTDETHKLYPNPVGERLYIRSHGNSTHTAYRIFDSTGRLLKSGEGTEINVADCDSGLLIVELDDYAGKYWQKIIKK